MIRRRKTYTLGVRQLAAAFHRSTECAEKKPQGTPCTSLSYMTTLAGAVKWRRPTTPVTRPISWLKAALKGFETFPQTAQSICLAALTIAAEGGKADLAKPMHGMGSGVFEIALAHKGNAFRVMYAVQLAATFGLSMPFRRNRHMVSRRQGVRRI